MRTYRVQALSEKEALEIVAKRFGINIDELKVVSETKSYDIKRKG